MGYKNWIGHLLIRIFALPIAFIMLYMVILGGRSDSMGLGLVYAFLALAIIGVLFLAIEAIWLYRRKLTNKFLANIFDFNHLLLTFPSTTLLFGHLDQRWTFFVVVVGHLAVETVVTFTQID